MLLLDTVDNDYVGIILGRDEAGKFRCFDQEISIPTEEEARNWMHAAIKWHARDGAKIFPQGDATKPLDLFTPVVPTEKFHPGFVHLLRAVPGHHVRERGRVALVRRLQFFHSRDIGEHRTR